jgi:DNA-binding CsgD family transcriptional regulator
MELLERDRFILDLARALREVEAGSGRTVLISGEAGIGKTALVQHYINAHRSTARILWGACEALFTPRPLGPLYDIARQTRSNLSELLSAQASRATIFSALLDELQRSAPLAIIVIEDVHWADEATLDMIKFLSRRIHQLPSLLIITHRDDELGAHHPLRSVLGDLPGASVTRLRLPALSEAAVIALAKQAQHSVEGLYAATGGNPFFVTEVLASHEQGVPATIRDAVLARAARLSSGARAVLDLASVVPAYVERWLLDTISPFDSALLDECVESGMLWLDNTQLAFRHELARIAVEDSLSPARRQSLHAQVLEALMTRATAQIPLSRLVHHATHAANGSVLVRFALAAAREAISLGAHREAVSQYATALNFAEQLGAEERANVLEDYAYQCYLTDRIDEAIHARLKALEIWRELSQHEKEGPTLRWLSRLSWFLGKKVDADAYASQAVGILERLPPGSELAMAYSNRAHLAMLVDETAATVEWGQRAIALAEKLGNSEIVAHALNNIGSALLNAGDRNGQTQLEKSLHISLTHGFEEHAARAYANLASCCVKFRVYADAMRYLNDGLQYCLDHDLDAWSLCMLVWRARCRLEQGYWQEAAEEASTVLNRSHVSTVFRIPALVTLARVRTRRGDPHVTELLDEARDLAMPTGELTCIAPVAAARAEAAWLSGEREQCAAAVRGAFELAVSHTNPWERGELSYWMWRAGELAHPPPMIAAPFAHHMASDWRAAASAWTQLGCPYERAMALADGDEAAQRAALEIFVQLDAGPAADIVRQKLRAQGVRSIPRGPRPTTRDNPAGLTARQMEVLTLMTEGLQNTEIATRLSTSPKTVDHHVSAVLAKLNVRSRAQAVIAAHQMGILPPQYRQSHEPK